MPGYKIHLVGGGLTFFSIWFLLSKCGLDANISIFTLIQWASACILGALFPDVDTKSKGQGIFYKIMFVFQLFLLWKRYLSLFVLLSFISLIPLLVRHRGLFHRVWFLVTIPLALAFVASESCPAYKSTFISNTLFFIAGALSHIVFDKLPYLS